MAKAKIEIAVTQMPAYREALEGWQHSARQVVALSARLAALEAQVEEAAFLLADELAAYETCDAKLSAGAWNDRAQAFVDEVAVLAAAGRPAGEQEQ
jgi:hypothetical protein